MVSSGVCRLGGGPEVQLLRENNVPFPLRLSPLPGVAGNPTQKLAQPRPACHFGLTGQAGNG